MKDAMLAVFLAALAGLTGCASAGTAEDFKWVIECPKTADKGAEFVLTVLATRPIEPAAEGGPSSEAIDGVAYRYQIHWTGGSSAPLRHVGSTGDPIKIRARMVPGPATILVTSENKDGLDVKVIEATIDVK